MKKKAFTLIELLVVIAIIAILAAILFPVFAQAKLAAKEVSGLSNTKQVGLGTLMYLNDYDDTYPLAAVLRPNGGKLGTGVIVPFPQNDGEVLTAAAAGANPTTLWSQPARVGMAASYAGNAVQPYIKSLVLPSLTGLTSYTDSAVTSFAGPGATGLSNLTFNGDLHHYSSTAVLESSIVPMWWPGLGSDNYIGQTFAEPALNCANTVDDCSFQSGANPSAGGVNLYTSQPGDVLFYNADPSDTPYPYSNERGPIVRCDGSAKSYNMTAPIYPQYLSPAGAWLEPFAEYYTPAISNSLYHINAWLSSSYYCNTGSTLPPGALNVKDYTCFFRPDRTK
jgi:prepilin-type N-terminal cleavage/methylation domain-containing protein